MVWAAALGCDLEPGGDEGAAGDSGGSVDPPGASDDSSGSAGSPTSVGSGTSGTSESSGADEPAPPSDGTFVSDGIATSDFGVAADGSVVLVGKPVLVDQWAVMVQCFAPDATPFDAQAIAEYIPEETSVLTDIRTDRSAAGNFAVSWWVVPSEGDFQTMVAFFDADCELVHGPEHIDPEVPSDATSWDATIRATDNGDFYMVYDRNAPQRLVRYGADGTFIQGRSLMPCSGPAMGLGVSRANANSVVFCQEGQGRTYRRFDAELEPVDADWLAVPNAGQPGNNHAAAVMNDDGAFAYISRRGDDGHHALVFDPDGALVAELDDPFTVAANPFSWVTPDGDFLFQVGGDGVAPLTLLSPQGQTLAVQYEYYAMKTDPAGNRYARLGYDVLRNPPTP